MYLATTAMKKKLTALLLGIFLAGSIVAQSESDERALINVSNGMSVVRDSQFLLNMRFRMQNRVGFRTGSLEDLSIDEIEARIRRLRLRFDGYVGSPRLQYYIQLSFSRADQDLEDVGDEPKIIRDAIVYYVLSDRFYVGLGQSKLPGNRQRVVSSGNLQFAERSIANRAFTVDRDFGIFGYYTFLSGDRPLLLKAAVSTGEGRNITRTNTGLAYTARLEWLPLGNFAGGGDYSEGDLAYEEKPKISLAAGFCDNRRTTQTAGQLGDQLGAGVAADIFTWIADAHIKWAGRAVFIEYMDRRADQTFVINAAGGSSYVGQGRALNVQLSQLLSSPLQDDRKLWEAVFRYSQVWPRYATEQASLQEVLLGVNRYLNKHRIKLQGHVGYNSLRLPGRDNQWLSAIFQVEFGI